MCAHWKASTHMEQAQRSYCWSWWVYPSWHWARGRVDLGQVTRLSLTHRDRQPFTLTFMPTDNLESPINLHVSGLWDTGRTCRLHTEGSWPASDFRPRTLLLWGVHTYCSYYFVSANLLLCHKTLCMELQHVFIPTRQILPLCVWTLTST